MANTNQDKQKLKKAIELQKRLDALQPECLFNVYDSNADWNKKISAHEISQIIDKKLESVMPHKKEVVPIKEKGIDKKNMAAYIVCLIVGLVGTILSACFLNSAGLEVLYGVGGGAVIFLAGVLGIIKEIRLFKKNNVNIKEIKKRNEENERYNLEVYPKLFEEFEKKKSEYVRVFLGSVNDAHKKVYAIRQQVEELNVLSFKFLPYAQDILDNIIDKRADNIKESINILLQEQDVKDFSTAANNLNLLLKNGSAVGVANNLEPEKTVLENDQAVTEFLSENGEKEYNKLNKIWDTSCQYKKQEYFEKFATKLTESRKLKLSTNLISLALYYLDNIVQSDPLGYSKKAEWAGWPNIFDRNKNKFVDFLYKLNHKLPHEMEPVIYNVIITLCMDYKFEFDDLPWLFDADFWQLPDEQCYEEFKKHLFASVEDIKEKLRNVLSQDYFKSLENVGLGSN